MDHEPEIGARLLATVTALVFGSSEPQITERGFEGLPKIRVFRRVVEIAVPVLAEMIESITVDPGLEVTLRASVATGEVTARWDDRLGNVDGLPASVHIGPARH